MANDNFITSVAPKFGLNVLLEWKLLLEMNLATVDLEFCSKTEVYSFHRIPTKFS